MVTSQGVEKEVPSLQEFTDWLGRHEERDINHRRGQNRISGQGMVVESSMTL